eukprot:gnl/TRDRNA2_/TRDRNA2_30317_c0_seq1.p1 gnl/TRDRNA2_/TRDRNA2_30317_c0~~gnl/TRDRNA2_/TRDRNA2_30317_c0_seq1.p1  ORF type:complete len:542 (-),score=83.02 gnl/TRDRNA2_/TRDRNA2_30317_c0_seq1:181-1806(-)
MKQLSRRFLWAAMASAFCPRGHSRGDPSCFIATVTFERCCMEPAGNSLCWEEPFNFPRCCGEAVDCLTHPDACYVPPTPELIELTKQAADAVGASELASQFEQLHLMVFSKHGVGVDPTASFMTSFAHRGEGSGYGEAGPSAHAFQLVMCFSIGKIHFRTILGEEADSDCLNLAMQELMRTNDPDYKAVVRRVRSLQLFTELYENLHRRGVAFFRVALQLFADSLRALPERSPKAKGHAVANLLALELEAHYHSVANTVQRLREHGASNVFVPSLGTLMGAVMQQASNTPLLQKWSQLVESSVQQRDVYVLVRDCLRFAKELFEDAVLLMTHAFSIYYLTELFQGTAPVSSTVVLTGQRFIFDPICCQRMHVLLHLLQGVQRGAPAMLEIGVHRGRTSQFLLEALPSLQWIGVDAYAEDVYGDRGDALFAKVSEQFSAFGSRAHLVRESSKIAWNISNGPVLGVEPGSLDLLFVDGDHARSTTRADLEAWSRLVRPGGIVAGHDIFNPVTDGVTEAVLELLGEIDVPLHFATDHTFWWIRP